MIWGMTSRLMWDSPMATHESAAFTGYNFGTHRRSHVSEIHAHP